MLKKIGIAIVVLLAVVVVALYVGPKLYDWNGHKADIAARVKAATGRDLAIDGDISASLLFTPTLSVSGVRFANAPGGSAPDMASFENLKVRVALGPLLSGDIKVESIVLVRPTILLERYTDGTANWELAPATTGGGAAGEGTQAGGGARPASVSLDKITIEKGRIVYRGPESGPVEIDDIDAELSARSLDGPFTATGTATVQGVRASFEANSGVLAPQGQMPIGLSLALRDADSRLTVKGALDQSGGQTRLTGHLTVTAANLAAALDKVAAGMAAGLPVALDRPFSLDGDVVAGPAAVEMSQVALQLGDTTAKGSVTYERSGAAGAPSRIAATLAFNKLDLDALTAPGAAAAETAPAGTAPARTAPAEAGTETVFALPTGVEAGLDLTVDAISFRNAVINRAHLAGKLEGGMLKLGELSALMPGNTDVTLTGTLTAEAGAPQFAGAVTGRSDNVRALLEWLQVPVSAIPADRLHKFALTSQITATPRLLQVSQMDLTVDTTRAAGGITLALPEGGGGNMAVGLGLAVDQINLDGYLPPPAAGAAEAAPAEAATPQQAAAGLPLDALKPLADVNANVQLKVGSLTYNAQTIQNLLLDGGLADGVLTLKELSVGDLAGGSGRVSGTVSDLAGAPRFDTRIDLAARDAARALRFAGLAVPAAADLGAMKLAGSLAGGAADVSYDLSFSIAGIGAEGQAKGTAQGLTQGVPRVDSTFSLSAKDAAPLLVIAGLGGEDQPPIGALTLSGTATSGADEVTYDMTLRLPDLGGEGKLKGVLQGLQGRPRVDTTLDLAARKPAPLLALAGLGGDGLDRLGALKVAGTLAGDAAAMKLDLGVDALGGTAKVAGDVGLPPEGTAALPHLDLSIQAAHPELRQLIAAFSGEAASGPKLGPFSLSTHATSTDEALTLSDLEIGAGDSRITGTASYRPGGARPKLTADLKADTLPLSALSGGGGGGKRKGGGSGAPWSREPLDTTPLTAFDADLALTAGTVALENDRIDDFDAKLTLADGVLTIDRLTGKTKGGSIDVKGELRGRGVPVAALTVAASNIELGELVHAGGLRVRGPVSLDGDFKASGVSMAEMIDALSGKGRVDGSVTMLSETERVAGGGLLAGLGLRVQELAGLTDIVGSVLGGYIGRTSKLAGNFVIERGILSTQDTALTNDQAKALAHGKVNLSAWTLDTVTDFYRGAAADSPWLSLGLTGRIDGPNVRLAGLALSPENLLPGTIQQLQSVPSGVLDQVVPGLLPGLSRPGASGATGGTAPQPLESLQDAVKGILGGESAAPPAAQPQTQTAPQPEAAPSEPKKKTSPLDEILPGVKGLFGQ